MRALPLNHHWQVLPRSRTFRNAGLVLLESRAVSATLCFFLPQLLNPGSPGPARDARPWVGSMHLDEAETAGHTPQGTADHRADPRPHSRGGGDAGQAGVRSQAHASLLFQGLLCKGCLPSRPEMKLNNTHKGLQRAGRLSNLTASPQRVSSSLQAHFSSFPPCLCPREAQICRNLDPDPRPVCLISFRPRLVGGTHVDPLASEPQGHCEGQYLHLGAQKAVVSALRACQAAHVFGGQLGNHAGPRGHTIAGVPKAHVQSQGARRGFSHRRLWFLVGLWWTEAQADCEEKSSQVKDVEEKRGLWGFRRAPWQRACWKCEPPSHPSQACGRAGLPPAHCPPHLPPTPLR